MNKHTIIYTLDIGIKGLQLFQKVRVVNINDIKMVLAVSVGSCHIRNSTYNSC